MKIGLDAKRAFLNYTGLGNYSRNVIRNLLQYYPENEYYLFTPFIQNHEFYEEVKKLTNVKLIQPRTKFFTPLWRSYQITKLINNLQLDIYHGLSNELPYNIRKSKVKKIVTIHDLIPFKEDVFRNVFEDYFAKTKLKLACKYANRIVSISKSTAKDIMDYFGTDEKKIKIVYQPIILKHTDQYTDELLDVKLKYQLPHQFLLQVGTVEYRKNIQIVLRALKQLKNTISSGCQENLHYVIIGKNLRFYKSLFDFVKNNGLKDSVQFIDGVNDNELACIYLLSTVVVYPSLYEGFGLPIVEALSFGKPVLTTKAGCFEEAGGSGAYYCNTNSVDEVANTIVTMLNTNNTQMIEAGLQHVAQFNAKAMTDALMEIYLK